MERYDVSYLRKVGRDNTLGQLHLPTIQHSVGVGGDELIAEYFACAEDRDHVIGMKQAAQRIVYCGRRCTEELVPFFGRVVCKDIFFAAIDSVLFEILGLFTVSFTEFLLQLLAGMTGCDGILDSVKHALVCGRKAQISVGVRIGGADLEAGLYGALGIADETEKYRTVSGRCVYVLTQRSDGMSRSFVTRLQTKESICCYGDERVDELVVLHKAHECTPADGAEEILCHIFRAEKVYFMTVFQESDRVDMCVFTGAGHTRKRLGAEADFQTVHTEDLFDKDSGKKLVVRSL